MLSRPLRILQIMRAPVGGLFRHVSDLTHELAARGHQVGIVADSHAGDAQTEAKLVKLHTVASLGVHRVPIPRLLGASDLITPLRIRRLSKALNVDVLHGHGAKGGFNARLAKLLNRKCVSLYTPHGGALHFDQRKPAGAAFMAIERLLIGQTGALIFESAHAQKVFAEKVKEPRCPHHVIHNGLAASEFEDVSPDQDAADFVYVGELRWLKGIDLLIEALAPLRRPDGTPATLVMAGDGPDAPALREKIQNLGLEQRVTLAGVQPARAMFARGRCVVVPSRAESLPYVVLEAAAAGRPVIATAVGGIGEIFGPTSSELVTPDNARALGVAMAAHLADNTALAASTASRRRHIQAQFSISHMTDQIEAVYRGLVAS